MTSEQRSVQRDFLQRMPWGLMAALSVALAMRVPYLTARSIWYDEASSWQTAKFSAVEMIARLRVGVHQPLYYWTLKGWMAAFGESVLALRSLSIALGLLTVAGMYLAARECVRWSSQPLAGDARSGLPAAVAMLVAVSAFQINASIEARMYALGTALTAFSVWALCRVLQAPGSLRRWAIYAALCVLLLYTHHYCLFIVASQFVYLLAYGVWTSHRLAVRSVVAMALVGIAYVPGTLLMLRQYGRVRQDYWTAPLSTDLIAQTFLEFISPVARLPDPKFWGTLSLAAFGGAALLVIRRAGRVELLVLAVAILPMFLAAGVSLLLSPVWEGRYFRFSQLFLLFVLALAAEQLGRGAVRRLALAVLVIGLAAASADFWRNRQIPARPGMAGAIARLMAMHNGRDPIVANSNIHYFPAKYYVNGRTPVRILRSSTQRFWGQQLIRAEDIVPDDQLRQWLETGVWFLSHSDVPAGVDMLRDAVVEYRFTSSFDAGVPPWTVHVSYVRVLSEGARIAAAIDRVRSGAATELDLAGLQQVDPYLPELAELHDLLHLRLDAAGIGDQHLELLHDCRRLQSLSLINTQTTDAGLASLARIQSLRRLDLDFTSVGDRGLAALAALGNLRELSLAGTQLTDAGLRQLAAMHQLESLVLDDTRVTDRGILTLAGLTQLAHLHVSRTAVSQAAADRLRQAIPELRIHGTFLEQETQR